MVKEVVIHIGMFKTGTTFLQKSVFPVAKDFFYYEKDDNLNKLIWGLNDLSPFNVLKRAEEINNANIYEKLLISREDISGSPMINYQDFWMHLHVIKHIVGRKTIVLTIRKQDDYLESLYKHYVQTGGTKSAKRFLSLENDYRRKNGVSVSSEMDYLKLINLIKYEIPGVNLVVLPYELLKSNLQTFIDRLNISCGLNISYSRVQNLKNSNVSVSARLIPVLRFLNNFIRYERDDKGLIRENPFSGILSLLPDIKVKFFLLNKLKRYGFRFLFQEVLSTSKRKQSTLQSFVKEQILENHRYSNIKLSEIYPELELEEFKYWN